MIEPRPARARRRHCEERSDQAIHCPSSCGRVASLRSQRRPRGETRGPQGNSSNDVDPGSRASELHHRHRRVLRRRGPQPGDQAAARPGTSRSPSPAAFAAAATLIAYVVFRVEIHFSLEARDMLLLYFFTGIGLNARLDDLISGGRPFLILLALTLVYLVIQNLIAASGVAALGLPAGMTPLLGSAALIGGHGTTIAWAPIIAERFGLRERARSRHRHRDARARGRKPRRRSDRRLPHPPPRALAARKAGPGRRPARRPRRQAPPTTSATSACCTPCLSSTS